MLNTVYNMLQGVALNIPPEDHYRQQITAVKHVGLKWSEYAKKVLNAATCFLPSSVLNTLFSLTCII